MEDFFVPPCGLLAKKTSQKIRFKSSPKSAQKNPPEIRTKSPHKKSTPKNHAKRTQKNPHNKTCMVLGPSEQLSSRPPPTQDFTTTVGEDLRWAQERIETLLPLTANTRVCSLLSTTPSPSRRVHMELKKSYFSRLWRENPLSRNRPFIPGHSVSYHFPPFMPGHFESYHVSMVALLGLAGNSCFPPGRGTEEIVSLLTDLGLQKPWPPAEQEQT